MHPFEREPVGPPPGVAAHLDVRLKAGWRFDRRRRALVPPSGTPVRLRGVLPAGTKVRLTAPGLAAAALEKLSEDEKLLARYLQVVPPADADPGALATALRGLDGVDHVSGSPRIGLP